MTQTLSMRAFALFAVTLLIAPAAFTAMTPPAHAIDVEKVSSTAWQDILTAVKTAYSAVKDAITAISTATSAAAEVALQIKNYVLQPLAWIISGNLLKSITASILGFINGKNGTGKPMYIQNLRSYLQNVGDVEAFSFLNQFASNSNSPFAGAITSSLRADYLQQTTATGFFAANKCTLQNASSNPSAFVHGDWSKGGIAAWFALTTQDQNNPYTLYFRAQTKLASQVQTAQAAKLAQANWGQGFLSWCGSSGGLGASGSGSNNPCQEFNLDTGQCTSCPAGATCSDLGSGGDTTGGTGGDFGGGGDATVSCPADTVQAGTVCGCTNPNGCDIQDTGTPGYAANTYVLPNGYSCPDGSSFDNLYGSCEYTADGTWTAVLDSSGSPVYQTESSSNLDAAPNGNTSSITPDTSNTGSGAQTQQVVNSLRNESLFNPTLNAYGGNCWQAVRIAECDAGAGSAFCTPQGQNSTGILQSAGWSTVTALTGQGTNAAISSYLQPGDIIQTAPIGSHTYGHVCMWDGSNCLSDTVQSNIVPYADYRSSPSLRVTIWRAPGTTAISNKAHNSTSLAAADAISHSYVSAGKVLAASTDSTGGGGSNVALGDFSARSGGIPQPGDACTKKDGTEGKIQTPGSVIKYWLEKALGSSIDKLVGVGDISTQIGGIMSNLGTIFSTVNLAASLANGGSGIFGSSISGVDTQSPFSSYLSSPGYLGLTPSSVLTNQTSNGISSDLGARVAQYQAAWATIGNAATAAATNLNNLGASCPTQASAAATALSTEVQPVLNQYQAAQTVITSANTLLAQMQTDIQATGDPNAYVNDVTQAQTMPPSATDIANAEADATNEGLATSATTGGIFGIGGTPSLTVGGAGSTVVDRMNLIAGNATAIQSNTTLCPPPGSTTTDTTSTQNTDTGGGGG